jgi:tRNA 2-selenouridine synthase
MEIQAFLTESAQLPILDVRSPSEYQKGHIQNAISFPLFSDEERAAIGTAYKRVSREKAMEMGYAYAAPRAEDYIEKAQALAQDKTLLLHCWRGGMRSEAMAKLLRSSGLEVYVLEGGYKSYRHWVKEVHARDYELIVLGGYTGTGKTETLRALGDLGAQILDLEGLAQHRGSAFGQMPGKQPTTESFENSVAHALTSLDRHRCIFVEDESHHIGSCWIDSIFFDRMRRSDLLILQRSLEERVEHLCEMYGREDEAMVRDAFNRIEKRLGGQNLKLALEAIDEGKKDIAARTALYYYDKTYSFGIEKRKEIRKFELNIEGLGHRGAAEKILKWKNDHRSNG